jgi:streptogramin lyase
VNKILHLIIACFWVVGLHAQRNATIQYTTKDGLQADELTSVFVDSRGMVWIGSSLGAARFDGKNVQNFTVFDGLGAAGVWHIFEDKNKRIWLHQYGYKKEEVEIAFLENNATKFQKIAIGTKLDLTDIGLLFSEKSPDPQILSGTKRWNLNPKTGETQPLSDLFSNEKDLTSYFWAKNQKGDLLAFYHKSNTKKGLKLLQSDETLLDLPLDGLNSNSLWSGTFLFENNKIALFGQDGFYFFGGKKWAKQPFDKQFILPQFGGAFDRTFYPNHTHFITKTAKNTYQFVKLTDNGQMKMGAIFKTPYEIRQFSSDKAGNFWVATTGGLLKIFPALLHLSVEDENFIADLHSLAEDKNGVMWFASNAGGMCSFDGQKIGSNPSVIPLNKLFQPGHTTDENEDMVFINGGYLIRFDGKKTIKKNISDFGGGFFLGKSMDGEVVFGGAHNRGIGIRAKNAAGWEAADFTFYGKEIGFDLVNVITAVKDKFGRWWMARPSSGIAVLTENRDKIHNFLRKDPKMDIGAMASVSDPWGNIWWGSTRGLAFWKPTRELDFAHFRPAADFRFFEKMGLGSDPIFQMICTPDSQLFYGTARGFAVIDLKTFYKSGEKVLPTHFFDASSGYGAGSTEQNAMTFDREGRVWIGADGGALRFDSRLFAWDKTLPTVRIDSVEAGKMWFPKKEKLDFDAADRNVRVYFSSKFDSTLQSQTYFVHRMTGDTAWSKPKTDNLLEFRNLATGKYRLEIQAWRDGIASKMEVLDFEIPVVWYLRWWFVSGVLAFFGGIFWYFQQKQLEIERTKQEKNKLQVQTIVNQLNPHFINNALQWVQVRVFEDKEATRVLSRLGENIRIVFRNTRLGKPFHTFDDEMRLVENYLLIQKARFGERLEYELPSKELILAYGIVPVPLMMLQIHCENGVEHGVANLEMGGKLTIKCQDLGEKLHISIEDNGIGRAAAAKIGSKGTQQGVKMLRELLHIFNQKNTTPISFEYEDLPFKNDENEPCGTRVLVELPKKYRYEFE